MPYKKEGHKAIGTFTPQNDLDRKLFLANQIAFNVRKTIKEELGYNASAGISYNKTLAKMATAENKPNGQTLVAIRYVKLAVGKMEIKKIRFCGGQVGDKLLEYGYLNMK